MLMFVLNVFTNQLYSQNNAFFYRDFLNDFLNKRIVDIQTTIIRKAVDGELNCYYNDSLLSLRPIEAVKSISLIFNKEDALDSLLLKKNGMNFIFQSEIKMIHSTKQRKSLNSIYISNVDGWKIACFSWKELEKKLSKNDYLFLSSLYQIKMNDIIQIDTSDRFFHFLNYKRNETNKKNLAEKKFNYWKDFLYNKSYYKLTKLDIKQISLVLEEELWYLIKNEIRYDEKVLLKDGKILKSFKDLKTENADTIIQEQVFINETKYKDSFIVGYDSISDIWYQRTIYQKDVYEYTGRDTMLILPFYINSGYPEMQMIGDNNIHTLSLNFKKNFFSDYKTTLSWKFVKKRVTQNWLIFLLEEYYKLYKKPIELY